MDELRDPVELTDDPSDERLTADDYEGISDAVVFSTDWTTETIIQQLKRENIQLNPRFQRRDAWSKSRKSLFIESLILGLPVPQLVLAELKEQRGKYVVLDGKQRLLALLHFWGIGQGAKNGYGLSGLEVRDDLRGKTIKALESDLTLRGDLTALQNATIRTVVIRNWPNQNFLHTVFLRLNTGSVKLSPQELRQALIPGNFTNFVDDTAIASEPLKLLLGLTEPDYRMRDVELLARYISFANFISSYPGRMKQFLDTSFATLNREWDVRQSSVQRQAEEFDEGIRSLMAIFGIEGVARKPGSRSFNKAIFDALIFYASDPMIRAAASQAGSDVKLAYDHLLRENPAFLLSVERDTAGTPNTATRFIEWGQVLRQALKLEFRIPERTSEGIAFSGFFG